MNRADWDSLPIQLKRQEWRVKLHKLSYSSEHRASCLPAGTPGGEIEALDFDSVKEYWYGRQFRNQVKSADALYVNSGKWYLVEFKYGSAHAHDVIKKYYDSIVGLVEHGCLTWDECLEKLTLILVAKNAGRIAGYDIGAKSGASHSPVWRCLASDVSNMDVNNDCRIQLAHYVQSSIVMTIDDFVAFVVSEGWR